MFAGIFLVYLAVFIAALAAIQWLVGFLASASLADFITFIIALGGMAAIAVLARHNQTGIVVTVAIGVFWSLLLLGTGSTTLMPTLAIAAAALYAAAAVTLVETFLRRRV